MISQKAKTNGSSENIEAATQAFGGVNKGSASRAISSSPVLLPPLSVSHAPLPLWGLLFSGNGVL